MLPLWQSRAEVCLQDASQVQLFITMCNGCQHIILQYC